MCTRAQADLQGFALFRPHFSIPHFNYAMCRCDCGGVGEGGGRVKQIWRIAPDVLPLLLPH